MADDDTEVTVQDEGVVEVDLGGEVAKPRDAGGKFVAVDQTKTVSRVKVSDQEPTEELNEATKALQATVDSEKKLRAAAEQTAVSATQRADQERQAREQREQELQRTRETLEQRELASVEADIGSATREVAAAQKEWAAAMSAGEFEKAAEIQTRLTTAATDLRLAEGRKLNIENRVPTTTGAVEQQPTVTTTPSPFEHYISGMAPAAQTWLRAHPECAPPGVGGKADMNSKMLRGHYDALAQGHSTNSDEYFRIIEESTGYRKPVVAAEDEGKPEPKPQVQQRQARPSAPPSREVPGSQQTGSTRTVRLSKDEQEMAKVSFPHMEPAKAFAEYARNKVALDSEGKLGRTSH